MTITGPLARAARALTQCPRAHIAQSAGLNEDDLRAFEAGAGDLDPEAQERLRKALQAGGAVFLPEGRNGGAGVRLKFTSHDVRAINRLEGEGGIYASDDV